MDYECDILHKQTTTNNAERSPDCDDMSLRSESQEMSLKQHKIDIYLYLEH